MKKEKSLKKLKKGVCPECQKAMVFLKGKKVWKCFNCKIEVDYR